MSLIPRLTKTLYASRRSPFDADILRGYRREFLDEISGNLKNAAGKTETCLFNPRNGS
jgi:hypothetical protein